MNKEEVVVELLASLEGKKEAMHIRNLVFVQEQNVSAEEEYDEFDAIAVHYLARLGSEYVGTARWRLVEDKIKFERFAVLKEHRGKGVGDKLLEACLQDARSYYPHHAIYLHAQIQVVGFYSRYGFTKVGERFSEAGIEHYHMISSHR